MGGIRECLDGQRYAARLDDKVTTRSGGRGERCFLQAISHPGGEGSGALKESLGRGVPLKP